MKAQEPIPINSAIVIGSGLAGLTAAMLLADMGKEVTVIERCHRPGGRVQQAEYPNGQHGIVGFYEWYDRQLDDNIWWLLDELGFRQRNYARYPDATFYNWRDEYHYDARWRKLIDSLPWDDKGGAAAFRASEDEVGELMGDVCVWPLDTGGYPDYDYTDFEDWMLYNPDETPHWRSDVTEFWDLSIRSEVGVQSYQFSAAFGILSCAYWDYSRATYTLKNGPYKIIEKLMQRIPSGVVHLNEQVSNVTNIAGPAVQVETNQGTYTADVAIVATQHSKVAGIVPELPSDKVASLTSMGEAKCFIALQQYSNRFWETIHGMAGWGGFSDRGVYGTTRPGAYTIGSETVNQTGSTGILSTYVNEPAASSLWSSPNGLHATPATKDTVTNNVLDDIETYWPEVRDYYIEGSGRVYQWDPYGPIWPVGHVLNGNYAKNKLPVGRIYFAGDYIEDFGGGDAVLSARDAVAKFT